VALRYTGDPRADGPVGPYILANGSSMTNLSARSIAAPKELMLAPRAIRPTYLS
jgi:hypothetical protein